MPIHDSSLPPARLEARYDFTGQRIEVNEPLADGSRLPLSALYLREDLVEAEVKKRVATIAASVRRRQENCAKAGDEGAFHMLCALAEDLEGGQL